MENVIETVKINRKAVGAKLAELREARELTQEAVGEALGLLPNPRARIWNFEHGVGLTIENIANLARFYEKPIEFFINE